MATFAFHCNRCPASFPTTVDLSRHVRKDHHPLTTAIDFLAGRITNLAMGGATEAQLEPSRRLLIRLIGERAADVVEYQG